MCDRLIGGMLWCAGMHWSLTRAHPHREGTSVCHSRSASYQCFFGGVMLSESGSIRDYMCDDGSYGAQVCIGSLALLPTMGNHVQI